MSRVRRSSIWAKLKSKSEPSLVHVREESKWHGSAKLLVLYYRMNYSVTSQTEGTNRRMWSSQDQQEMGGLTVLLTVYWNTQITDKKNKLHQRHKALFKKKKKGWNLLKYWKNIESVGSGHLNGLIQHLAMVYQSQHCENVGESVGTSVGFSSQQLPTSVSFYSSFSIFVTSWCSGGRGVPD